MQLILTVGYMLVLPLIKFSVWCNVPNTQHRLHDLIAIRLDNERRIRADLVMLRAFAFVQTAMTPLRFAFVIVLIIEASIS